MAGPLPIGEPVPKTGLLSPTEIEGAAGRTFHAYLHIPFCKDRCGYCDFNTYTANELGSLKQSDYPKSLISEIVFSKEVLNRSEVPVRPLSTIFFGGGTPSLLSAPDLVGIISALANQFEFEPNLEITLEANPDTVTVDKFAALRKAGVNRVSLGMQSSDSAVLQTLERTHDPKNVEVATKILRELGFEISLDLIFGAPGETLEQWEKSLSDAILLAPGHISAYSLIVEPGTKLARQISSGIFKEIDEDLQAEKYELADRILGEAGFHWYEISNWAKSDALQSKHNLAYWKGQDWWGYGPGAHSHVGSVRWWNYKHPTTYASKLQVLSSPAAGKEQLDADTRALERILLESRTSSGMQIKELTALAPQAKLAIPQLIADGLIEGQQAIAGQLVLTLKGRLLADAVVRSLTN